MTVLADAAQSMGGASGNARVGALAPISATSFYPTKPLGCYGDGGAILTEREDLAERVRMIRSHGRQGTGDAAMVLGLTGRLDTIQAAVLLVKLDVFEVELQRRRAIAARYNAGLRDVVDRADDSGRSAKRLRDLHHPGREPRPGAVAPRRSRHRHRAVLPPRTASAPGVPRTSTGGTSRSRSG